MTEKFLTTPNQIYIDNERFVADILFDQLIEEEFGEMLIDIVAEEGQTAWAESESGGAVTEQDYLQRLTWRAGNVGHALDVTRANIDNETDAEAWLELKMVVKAVEAMSDPSAKVDAVIELERAGYDLVQHIGFDAGAYEGVRNK